MPSRQSPRVPSHKFDLDAVCVKTWTTMGRSAARDASPPALSATRPQVARTRGADVALPGPAATAAPKAPRRTHHARGSPIAGCS